MADFFCLIVTFLKERCPTIEDGIMKDIITSGLFGAALVIMLLIAAPITNGNEEVETAVIDTELVAHENNPNNEVEIKSKIHTPL